MEKQHPPSPNSVLKHSLFISLEGQEPSPSLYGGPADRSVVSSQHPTVPLLGHHSIAPEQNPPGIPEWRTSSYKIVMDGDGDSKKNAAGWQTQKRYWMYRDGSSDSDMQVCSSVCKKLWMELLQTYDNDNNNLSLSLHIDMCVQHVSKGVNILFYVACCMILSVAWISIIFARWSCKRYMTTWCITTICTSSSLCILKHNIYPICHTHSITLKIYSVILH